MQAERNAITIDFTLSFQCYPRAPVPCGLSIVQFDEKIIEWEEDDQSE